MLVSAFRAASALPRAAEILLCAGNARRRCMPSALTHLASVPLAGSTPRLLQRLRHSAAGERTCTCSPAMVHAQRTPFNILAAPSARQHCHAVTHYRDKARMNCQSHFFGFHALQARMLTTHLGCSSQLRQCRRRWTRARVASSLEKVRMLASPCSLPTTLRACEHADHVFIVLAQAQHGACAMDAERGCYMQALWACTRRQKCQSVSLGMAALMRAQLPRRVAKCGRSASISKRYSPPFPPKQS